MRRPEDSFVYDVVVVPSFEDALIAVLFNHNVQAVVIRYGFPFASRHNLDVLHRYLEAVDERALEGRLDADCSLRCETWPADGWKSATEVYPALAADSAKDAKLSTSDNPDPS